MILYLDQNYASRIAKYLLGQRGHDHFGALYEVLRSCPCVIPASPFHVLELQEGYLLPKFQELFGELSQGYWVRPWQELLSHQLEAAEHLPGDLLTTEGDWDTPALLEPLEAMVHLALEGSLTHRIASAQEWLLEQLDLPPHGRELPLIATLSKLLAFRSLNEERQPHDSDLADLLIAASVRPYAPLFATDRFVREALDRLAMGEGAFSGRRHHVRELTLLCRT